MVCSPPAHCRGGRRPVVAACDCTPPPPPSLPHPSAMRHRRRRVFLARAFAPAAPREDDGEPRLATARPAAQPRRAPHSRPPTAPFGCHSRAPTGQATARRRQRTRFGGERPWRLTQQRHSGVDAACGAATPSTPSALAEHGHELGTQPWFCSELTLKIHRDQVWSKSAIAQQTMRMSKMVTQGVTAACAVQAVASAHAIHRGTVGRGQLPGAGQRVYAF